MAEKILSEGHAKKQEERAMEMLREVRQWVWDQHLQWLPANPDSPVDRYRAEAYAAYKVWYFTLRDAMHMIDPGYDDRDQPAFVLPEDDAPTPAPAPAEPVDPDFEAALAEAQDQAREEAEDRRR